MTTVLTDQLYTGIELETNTHINISKAAKLTTETTGTPVQPDEKVDKTMISHHNTYTTPSGIPACTLKWVPIMIVVPVM